MALLWFTSSSYYDDYNIIRIMENTNDYSDTNSLTKMEQQYYHENNNTTTGTVRWEFNSGEFNLNEIIFGMSVYYTAVGPSTHGIEFRYHGDPQFTIKPREDGSFEAYRGDYGDTLLAVSNPGLFRPGEWFYLEIKSYVANSPNGYWNVRVDGQDVFAGSGEDTQYQSSAGVSIIAMRGDGKQWGSANHYVCDDTGSDWNDFMGPLWIRALPPITSGEHQEWTASGESTNLDCINDTADSPPLVDYDTYINSVTDGQIDTYKFELTENVAGEEILAVGVGYFVEHDLGDTMPDEAGTTAAVYHTESDFEISGETSVEPWIAKSGVRVYQAKWEKNPSGEIAWTREAINSGEFGVQFNKGQY